MADVTVNILGDANSLRRALGESESALSSFASKAQTVGDRATSVGRSMTFGMTLPLVAIGKSALDSASDLNESMSKANQIFEGNSAAIRSWADGAARDFGQSKQQALENAASFGNMFRQLGMGIDPATKMSKQMVELASDFASFHNADISDVLLAQQAAFRGEYDALQRFVPTINAAAVQQRAMADTGKTNTQALTDQEKALATYELMLSGAGKAQGDFDRTASGAANQMRITKAELANASAEIGQRLLPIVQKLVGWVSDAANAFASLPAPMQDIILAAGLMVAAIGPISYVVGAASKAISAAISIAQSLASAFETMALKAMYAKDATALLSGAMVPGGIIVAGVAVAVAGLTGAFDEQGASIQEVTANLNKMTNAEISAFIVKMELAGQKLFGHSLLHQQFVGILNEDVATAQRFIEVLKEQGRNTDWYTERLEQYIQKEHVANSERDAAKATVDALRKSVEDLPGGKTVHVDLFAANATADLVAFRNELEYITGQPWQVVLQAVASTGAGVVP